MNIFYKEEGTEVFDYDINKLLPRLEHWNLTSIDGPARAYFEDGDKRWVYKTYACRTKQTDYAADDWAWAVLWQLSSGFVDPVVVFRERPSKRFIDDSVEEYPEPHTYIFYMRLVIMEREDAPDFKKDEPVYILEPQYRLMDDHGVSQMVKKGVLAKYPENFPVPTGWESRGNGTIEYINDL